MPTMSGTGTRRPGPTVKYQVAPAPTPATARIPTTTAARRLILLVPRFRVGTAVVFWESEARALRESARVLPLVSGPMEPMGRETVRMPAREEAESSSEGASSSPSWGSLSMAARAAWALAVMTSWVRIEPVPPPRRTDSSESVSSSTTLRSSASASSASAGRSWDSRRVMVATSSSTSAGMSGTSLEGRGTSSWTLRKAIWMGESALKGCSPVRSS